MRKTDWLFAAAIMLPLAVAGASALAGSSGQPEQAPPQGEDPPGADQGAPESQTPQDHKGVIKPPPTGDKDIETDVPNPNAGHDEEVIPPPDGQVEPR
jgi:hypothetical protein